MNLYDAIGVILAIFGLAGFAGGAVGYFAKGRAEAVIALQAKENRLLKDDNTRLEKAVAALTAENGRLKVENERLWEKAQGSPELVKLTEAVKSNTEAVWRLAAGTVTK